ncbi:hypothetical protein AYL99_11664 [Fonsecaea erecta]|uniref:Uncharacterized protein n=1 Tax=Fonsecaea erecta TaxID=1367422 RepID=A0A178Z2V1_9EURO|nr:hypothetical protein AYL99_11664 [Fonsecaea erecta]OAP54129.1 hypothetical protein AYL99_11664 [Fonsecaea erecta]
MANQFSSLWRNEVFEPLQKDMMRSVHKDTELAALKEELECVKKRIQADEIRVTQNLKEPQGRFDAEHGAQQGEADKERRKRQSAEPKKNQGQRPPKDDDTTTN